MLAPHFRYGVVEFSYSCHFRHFDGWLSSCAETIRVRYSYDFHDSENHGLIALLLETHAFFKGTKSVSSSQYVFCESDWICPGATDRAEMLIWLIDETKDSCDAFRVTF